MLIRDLSRHQSNQLTSQPVELAPGVARGTAVSVLKDGRRPFHPGSACCGAWRLRCQRTPVQPACAELGSM